MPGRQGICALRKLNPACGSADLFRTPSAVLTLLFPVPSRGVAVGRVHCSCGDSRHSSFRRSCPLPAAALFAGSWDQGSRLAHNCGAYRFRREFRPMHIINRQFHWFGAKVYGFFFAGEPPFRFSCAISTTIDSRTATASGAAVVSQSSFSSASCRRSFHRSQTWCLVRSTFMPKR
jgi:hypothetical protein